MKSSRSVVTRALSQTEVAAAGIVFALCVGAFLQLTARQSHGIATAALLGVAAVAIAYAGGPSRLARRITRIDDTLVIERYNRVITRVDLGELADAKLSGRALLLEPKDVDTFYAHHRELRDVATPEGARVALGRREDVAAEVAALLTAA